MKLNSNDRKQIYVALVAFFLLFGGGVFVFFIFQGLGDLRGGSRGGIAYGFAARTAALPMFQYFGLSEDEKPAPPIRNRGMDLSLVNTQGDVSDWTAGKGAADGASGGTPGEAGRNASGGASAQIPGATRIPRMSRGGGGGGSQTSGGVSSLPAGAGAGNVNISGGRADGKGNFRGRGGALKSLAVTRAALGDGLRSGSAMAAKSKWGQAFGVGPGGGSDNMAYGASGMVKLDTIKSGEIDSLKTTGDVNTLKPSAIRDLASESKSVSLAKMNGKEGADAAKDAMKDALGQMGSGGGGADKTKDKNDPNAKDPVDPKTGKPVELPPAKVVEIATKPPPDGTFCPKGCGEGGDAYKDSKISYAKGESGKWQVTYEGTQSGRVYKDTMAINPDAPKGQQITPVGSQVFNERTQQWQPPKDGFGGSEI
jgi:hypothetical protein